MDYTALSPIAATLENGMTLHYLRHGKGIPMILIHGAMGDWRSWTPQWETFTAQYDCITYSRRYSHPNPNPMNSTQHNALVDAEDLEQLMDRLKIEKAILVGSSYGGFTALAMALRAPDKVLAAIAVEPPMMRYALDAPQTAQIAQDFLAASAEPARAAFERGNDTEGVMLLTGGIMGRDASAMPDHVMQRRLQNAAAAKSLALSDDEFPKLDPAALGQIAAPVLLMSGAQTADVHKAIFKSVSAAMPNAETRIIEGSGHSVSKQQPDVFNKTVLDFLDRQNLHRPPRQV